MPTEDKRVLVVDDDPNILTFWKFTLKSLGENDPITAKSDSELKKADINFRDIKFAIVDFQFEESEVNGADIIQFLRSQGVARVYLSTGYADRDDVCRKARAMGIDGIIPKPVSKERVKEILSEFAK